MPLLPDTFSQEIETFSYHETIERHPADVGVERDGFRKNLDRGPERATEGQRREVDRTEGCVDQLSGKKDRSIRNLLFTNLRQSVN